MTINLVALDVVGRPWNFDVTGAFTTTRGGLLRSDSVWKSLGKVSVLTNNAYGADGLHGPVVLLTSHLPRPAPTATGPCARPVPASSSMPSRCCPTTARPAWPGIAAGRHPRPLAGFWSQADVDHSG